MFDDLGYYNPIVESEHEYIYHVGSHNEDQCWILSDRDVWYRNPFYTGPEVEHPEYREG